MHERIIQEHKEARLPQDVVLLSGSSNPELVRRVGDIFGVKINNVTSRFRDGECRVKIPENLRNKHAIIIQSTCPPNVDSNIMELMLSIDAAERASAKEITAIIPYFGYARQDRKEQSRVPISASVVADMIIHAGARRIVTVDIHSDQEEGFIKKPWDNLYASYCLIPVLKKQNFKNLVIGSPDNGGFQRATSYARLMGTNRVAICFKARNFDLNDESEVVNMIGDVKGCTVALVDDIAATLGSLTHAAPVLKEKGAEKIYGCITHGLFVDKEGEKSALDKLSDSPIEKIFVTDTAYLRPEVLNHPKIEIVSIAPLLAEAICRISDGRSLSELIK